MEEVKEFSELINIIERFGEYQLFNSYKSDVFNTIKKVYSYMDSYDDAVEDIEKALSKLNTTVIMMGKVGDNIHSLLEAITDLQYSNLITADTQSNGVVAQSLFNDGEENNDESKQS